ncbi:MAG TPA: hypothetical protein VD833_14925 [Vicinamibacterales bacterium]|nr:hypothetical protein [Vicinamibacterales bacterium]
MYTTVLLLHSWLRWLVLVLALLVIARGLSGWNGRRLWTAADNRAAFWMVTLLDVQMLIGLLLYFALSPVTMAALQDFGGAMGSSGLRYWAVEHPFGMIVAIALAHIGRARMRRTRDEQRRHRLAVVFFGLALVAILVSIPWPGLPNARPLIRW